jgi:uncharacterized membrane protein
MGKYFTDKPLSPDGDVVDSNDRTQAAAPTRPRMVRLIAIAVAMLVGIVLGSIGARLTTDWPNILAGTVPDDDFAERYVAHPWISYLHIGLGLAYLLGAPLQLSRRFRTRHYPVHRRLGRVLLTCGLFSGVFALIFGLLYPWGGPIEGSATLIFGLWFVASLVLAFRAIRRGDVRQHRRWMIRAFAVGVGIGTIRIWIGIFTAVVLSTSDAADPLLPDPFTFGISFWLAFTMHVAIGEWWLRRTPALDG